MAEASVVMMRSGVQVRHPARPDLRTSPARCSSMSYPSSINHSRTLLTLVRALMYRGFSALRRFELASPPNRALRRLASVFLVDLIRPSSRARQQGQTSSVSVCSLQ